MGKQPLSLVHYLCVCLYLELLVLGSMVVVGVSKDAVQSSRYGLKVGDRLGRNEDPEEHVSMLVSTLERSLCIPLLAVSLSP